MTNQLLIGKTQDNYMNIHWNPSVDNSLLVQGYYPQAQKVVNALEKELNLQESKAIRKNTFPPHITVGKDERIDKRFQHTFETRLAFLKSEKLQDISHQVKPIYLFPQSSLTFTDQKMLAEILIYGKALNIHSIGILGISDYYDPLYDMMTAQVHIREDDTFSFKSLLNNVEDGVFVKNKE